MDPRLSWTVKHRGGRDERRDRQLEDLEGYVRELCATAFPQQQGYAMSSSALAGPIEGSTIAVARGDFRALVSVQAYRRGDPHGALDRELRVVACAGSQRIADGERELERATRSGSVLGGSSGILLALVLVSLAGALVGFSPLGLVSGWNTALLIAPALLGGAAVSVLGSAFGRVRGKRVLDRARELARHDRRLQSDMERWNHVLEDLASRRSVVADQVGSRPFRTAGAPLRPLLAP